MGAIPSSRQNTVNTHNTHSTYNPNNPVSPIADHDAAYSRQNLGESSIDQTGARPFDPSSNVHGTGFGLTPTGEHHHADSSPLQQPVGSTYTDSSVSNLTSASGNETYHPPRGTAVRFDSATAPETITGNVEHVTPTASQHHIDNTTTPVTTTGDNVTPAEGGVKKQGTLSKLFKRKPVGGAEQPAVEGEKKRFY